MSIDSSTPALQCRLTLVATPRGEVNTMAITMMIFSTSREEMQTPCHHSMAIRATAFSIFNAHLAKPFAIESAR
jgi:hypothetical protein